ncbi:GNAT family N-acetyltransferase [Texcoconibacillus texcoconensis]|uniref:Putative N-acetyltransferase YhbS n=1 Tax=Texcoconibacillus texcoconensis TaxID=1095777 RepID=A0A840QLK6_9BACI|nr:GNAT family N-acetyltransferase [Texcoconibacillus texcoconensis]MBB5172230.1 putative N-acetyltransferase YhbS [Texcoconibacillus texcoconensis]
MTKLSEQASSLTIRSETIEDYTAIANLYAETGGVERGAAVALQRSNPYYDPNLSIVAELDYQIVAHVLIIPQLFIVNGQWEQGAVIGPTAVSERFKEQGIVENLIQSAHDIVQRKRCTFILVLEAEGEYGQLGYLSKVFGHSHVTVERPAELINERSLSFRKPKSTDLPQLSAMWEETFADAGLALFPGINLTDWISHDKQMNSFVIEQWGQPIGYIRYNDNDIGDVKALCAKNGEALSLIIDELFERSNAQLTSLRLPLPQNRTEWLGDLKFEVDVHVLKSGMIYPLTDDVEDSIQHYIENVQNRKENLGVIQWPTAFDLMKS